MIYQYILSFLPLLFLIAYTFAPRKRGQEVSPVSFYWTLTLLLTLGFTAALSPIDEGTDKFLYVNKYHLYPQGYFEIEDLKDIGWFFYNLFINLLSGDRENVFFIITALLYVFSFYFLARRYFRKEFVGYFVLMSVGCLGFGGYINNTIRAGLALALLFYAMCTENKWYRILIVLVAISMHKSMIVPITAYIASGVFKSRWYAYSAWVTCLVLAILSIDLSGLFEQIGFIDNRILTYTQSIGAENLSYNSGFRVDFLIYSAVPIAIGYYYIEKLRIPKNSLYSHIFCSYIIANAVWLLVIRMAYSDRMAYLSWFMIPILTLYPVLQYPKRFKDPQSLLLKIMYIYIGVSITLSIRNLMR